MRTMLTVVEQVSYQQPDAEPVAVVTRYVVSSDVENPEQVYERSYILPSKEWQRLDIGWFREHKCSLLIVSNPAKDAKTLHLTFSQEPPMERGEDIDIFIPPGEGCRFRPSSLDRIWVRCQEDSARVILTIFP